MGALSATFENKSKDRTVEMTFDDTEFGGVFQAQLFGSSMKSPKCIVVPQKLVVI